MVNFVSRDQKQCSCQGRFHSAIQQDKGESLQTGGIVCYSMQQHWFWLIEGRLHSCQPSLLPMLFSQELPSYWISETNYDGSLKIDLNLHKGQAQSLTGTSQINYCCYQNQYFPDIHFTTREYCISLIIYDETFHLVSKSNPRVLNYIAKMFYSSNLLYSVTHCILFHFFTYTFFKSFIDECDLLIEQQHYPSHIYT